MSKLKSKKSKTMKLPKVGDTIYVDSSFYISHGEDDFVGGKCEISKVEISKRLPIDHCNSIMIEVKERPGTLYNYKYLLEEQDKLKKEFRNKKGHADPDINTPWIEEGDIVNGEIYHGPDIW